MAAASPPLAPIASPRARSLRSGLLATLPAPLAWLLVFYLAPLLFLLVKAVWVDGHLTTANLETIATNSLYPRIFLRTLLMATVVTITDVVLAFPLAFFLAKLVRRHREFLLVLVVFPLWSSYLVRAFAWKSLLGTKGILNSVLIWAGVIDDPLGFLLYSKWAMYIAFCHVWLPFMIIPLYTIIDRVPNALLEASADLGAGPLTTFRRVLLPLSLPGILAGSLSVFSLTMGDYITPTLLGGPGDQMVGRIVADQFGVANNWPLGAALVIPTLLTISLFIFVANRAGAMGRGAA